MEEEWSLRSCDFHSAAFILWLDQSRKQFGFQKTSSSSLCTLYSYRFYIHYTSVPNCSIHIHSIGQGTTMTSGRFSSLRSYLPTLQLLTPSCLALRPTFTLSNRIRLSNLSTHIAYHFNLTSSITCVTLFFLFLAMYVLKQRWQTNT